MMRRMILMRALSDLYRDEFLSLLPLALLLTRRHGG